jgi:hypothetical protein
MHIRRDNDIRPPLLQPLPGTGQHLGVPGSGWSRGGRISLSRRICIFVPPRRLTRANSIRSWWIGWSGAATYTLSTE